MPSARWAVPGFKNQKSPMVFVAELGGVVIIQMATAVMQKPSAAERSTFGQGSASTRMLLQNERLKMSNVIDLASRRKKEKPSAKQIIEESVEDLQQNWEKFARLNRLNDFFISSTPNWSNPDLNYLEDLDAISVVEQKINLILRMESPGFVPENRLGWTAAVRLDDLIITTPPMPTEQYARTFLILLYLKVKRELVRNGL